tara:strand:- start:23207 stop:23488 length:282 start_codon:yes stop_codon:yes gene_type:complete
MYLEEIIELDTALLARECGFPQLKDTDVYDYSDITTWDRLRDDTWELGVGESDMGLSEGEIVRHLKTFIGTSRNTYSTGEEMSVGEFFNSYRK